MKDNKAALKLKKILKNKNGEMTKELQMLYALAFNRGVEAGYLKGVEHGKKTN